MMIFKEQRTTNETRVSVDLQCERGPVTIVTPVPFVSHLLTTLITHAGWSGEVQAEAMLDPDGHHLAEDCGLVLGQALWCGLQSAAGYQRYGWSIVPMDDALARVAVDVGGRPYLRFDVDESRVSSGTGWTWDMVRELWAGLSRGLQATCHVSGLWGVSGHHLAEAMAKAGGLALGQACLEGGSIISTKGTIG